MNMQTDIILQSSSCPYLALCMDQGIYRWQDVAGNKEQLSKLFQSLH